MVENAIYVVLLNQSTTYCSINFMVYNEVIFNKVIFNEVIFNEVIFDEVIFNEVINPRRLMFQLFRITQRCHFCVGGMNLKLN